MQNNNTQDMSKFPRISLKLVGGFLATILHSFGLGQYIFIAGGDVRLSSLIVDRELQNQEHQI